MLLLTSVLVTCMRVGRTTRRVRRDCSWVRKYLALAKIPSFPPYLLSQRHGTLQRRVASRLLRPMIAATILPASSPLRAQVWTVQWRTSAQVSARRWMTRSRLRLGLHNHPPRLPSQATRATTVRVAAQADLTVRTRAPDGNGVFRTCQVRSGALLLPRPLASKTRTTPKALYKARGGSLPPRKPACRALQVRKALTRMV